MKDAKADNHKNHSQQEGTRCSTGETQNTQLESAGRVGKAVRFGNPADTTEDITKVVHDNFGVSVDKKEVVGIVDNLNNERVATLIKCKQVDKLEPKGCGKYLGGMGIDYSVCGRLDNGGELLLCDKCKQVDKSESTDDLIKKEMDKDYGNSKSNMD